MDLHVPVPVQQYSNIYLFLSFFFLAIPSMVSFVPNEPLDTQRTSVPHIHFQGSSYGASSMPEEFLSSLNASDRI